MFHFKKFSIDDSRAAMKIGTDSVMLGAWADCSSETRILDIGTGTGILALMMAQRNPGISIDAVELEYNAAELAVLNTKLSPWQAQIRIINSSIQDFANHNHHKYSLILCNPPFFTSSLKSQVQNRNLARHNDFLAVRDLLSISSKLLSVTGKASFVLPADAITVWKAEAEIVGLFIQKFTYIKSTSDHRPHRILLTLTNKKGEVFAEDEICIYTSTRTYTSEYRDLTRDFYLHF
jgi:tRNA1Val (adenine37-N6)-methyltransferase